MSYADPFAETKDTWISFTDAARRVEMRAQTAAFASALRRAHPEMEIRPRGAPKQITAEKRPRQRDYLWLASPGFERLADSDKPVRSKNWRKITHAVAAKHGFSVIDICSARRTANLVIARQEVMYELRQNTTMSLPAIGKRLGGKDHTTVIYGIRRHLERRKAGLA